MEVHSRDPPWRSTVAVDRRDPQSRGKEAYHMKRKNKHQNTLMNVALSLIVMLPPSFVLTGSHRLVIEFGAVGRQTSVAQYASTDHGPTVVVHLQP